MPDLPTSLRVPRYASAPSSPLTGQVYYDTSTNALYCYDGTAWRSAFEVYEGATAPSPRDGYLLWLDTSIP